MSYNDIVLFVHCGMAWTGIGCDIFDPLCRTVTSCLIGCYVFDPLCRARIVPPIIIESVDSISRDGTDISKQVILWEF